jgi:predicted acetyltransferase
VSNFEVGVASPADRLPIYRMLELYQHDLSHIWDQDLDSHGEYGYALDRYWDSEGFYPFVATAAGKYAGFALANQAVRIGTEGYWMDQFFVLKKYRRQGIGKLLARSVFTALPGRWEVGQLPRNLAAQVFWRNVLSTHTDGRFKEHEVLAGSWQGIIQVFESSSAQ